MGRVDPTAVAPSKPVVDGGVTLADPTLRGTVMSGFRMAGTFVPGLVAGSASAGSALDLGDEGILTIRPLTVAATASPATKIAGGDGVIFANTGVSSDMSTRPTPLGIEIFVQVRGPEAAEGYSWDFHPENGGRLEPLQGGGAALKGQSDELLAIVTHPTALDGTGRPVPATLAVDGERLTMTVAHRGKGFVYPIVADPNVVATALPDPGQMAWCMWRFRGGILLPPPIGALVAAKICTQAHLDTEAAREGARRRFPGPGLSDGKGDAYRHCMWSGLLTRHLGPETAHIITQHHENPNPRNPRERAQRAMDLHNNWMGRVYGNAKTSVEWLCLNKGMYGPAQLKWNGHGIRIP